LKKLLTYLFFILFIQSTWAISDKGNDDVVFIENKGQWHKNVLYKLEITNGALFFEQDRVSWRLIEPSAAESVVGHENHNHGFTDHQEDQLQFIFQSVFVGANLDNIQVPTSPREDYRNYIMGDNPKNWASNVKLYKQLTYKNLYNSIDVEYYGYQDFLKYDWIVHPGGNTNDIVTAYTKNVQLSTLNGELIIHAPTGEIKELKPYAYQLINGTRNEVVCEFNLKGQEVSFTIGDYDKSLPLVIDPQVVFSSYSGSTADNWGFTATYDNLGRLYGGGVVFDVGYPITTNNVQNVFNKPPNRFITTSDIGISVFNSTGSALIYSTYLGGKDYDQPQSMVVNKNMELVVYGTTGSSDFPIPSSGYRNFHSGGPQVNLNGLDIINGADIFVVKLNSQGNAITGGTFMGGIKSDGPNFGIYNNYGDISRGEVVLDSADNIYVASPSVLP